MEIEKKILRKGMEKQFRYILYQNSIFPFLQSLGIKNVLQSFADNEVGFIGILHLWWKNINNAIEYEANRETPFLINGIWKSEWLDTPEEGIRLAKEIENKKPFDENKMIKIHQNWFNNAINP